MKPKYHTHIDTLHLSFDNIDSRNYFNSASNIYKIHQTATMLNYTYSFNVYSTINNEFILFASIYHQSTVVKNYSKITMENYALYCPTWSNILNQLIYDLQLDISIRKMEIAIDTPKNILKKLHTVYMNSNKLIIKDSRYDWDNYGKTKFVKSQGYKKYFNNTATQKLFNDKTSTNSQFDRFENKTNEINQSSHKYYILDYLSDHFDTSTSIFRYEKTLFFEDLTYKNPVYLNVDSGETITKHYYEKLNNALKYNFIPGTEYSKMEIDFSRLEDPDYLTSLFNHFSLFNHEIILDTYKKTPHFKPKYVKHFNIVKPSSRSITIANSKQSITDIKAEYERINTLYTIDKVESLQAIKQKELDILFNTPIPPVYIPYDYLKDGFNDYNNRL